MHEDGAEVHRNKEFYICSASSSTTGAHTNVFDSKFTFAMIPAEHMRSKAVKAHVHEKLVQFIKWCSDALIAGVGPTHGFHLEVLSGNTARFAGQQLLGGWRMHCALWDKGRHKGSRGSQPVFSKLQFDSLLRLLHGHTALNMRRNHCSLQIPGRQLHGGLHV